MDENKSGSQELIDRVVLFMFVGMGVVPFGFFWPEVFLFSLFFIVTFGSLIAGTFLIIRSHFNGDREAQEVTDEISAMANDVSFDVSEQIIFWNKLKYTKGIGTQLEGQEAEISQIYNQLVNAREEIAAAESPQHKIEACLAADSVLATARMLH